jgi:dissimilatory sulfite reductase (desulfoviridin) alpha/beta subunit
MADELRGWRLEVCRGAQGCPNRAASDDGLGPAIEELFPPRLFGERLAEMVGGRLKRRHEFRVAVSDCPNACSQPQIADVGLVGAAEPQITNAVCHQCMGCVAGCAEGAVSHPGLLPIIDPARCLSCGMCSRVCLSGTIQVGRRGYRILVGGNLGRHPRLAQAIRGVYGREAVLAAVGCCLDYYLEHAIAGERLGSVLERLGRGGLEARIRERALQLGIAPPRAPAPILRGPV